MRNSSESTLKEIENSLKKIQERSSGKKVIFAIIGMSILIFAIIFAVIKLKKKIDEDAEIDEIDDLDDEFDDDDEIREDYYALDYEDEE